MNLTVLLVGLIVLAIFILPFYYVIKFSGKKSEDNTPIASKPDATSTTQKITKKYHPQKAS